MKRTGPMLCAVTMALLSVGQVPICIAQDDAPSESGQLTKPRIIYSSPRVVLYQLRRLSHQELVLVDRNASDPKYRPVYEAILTRPGLEPRFRGEAIKGLSELNKTDYVTELTAGIRRLDQIDSDDQSVLLELGRQLITSPAVQLKRKRAVLEEIATDGQLALPRQIAFAAIVTADGGLDSVWAKASQRQAGLVDLIDALPMIPDPKLCDAFYSRIELQIKRPHSDIVRQAAIRTISFLPGHDAKTFALLADLICSDQQRKSAIVSIRRTDKTTWPADRIGPLVESLLEFAENVPTSERGSDVFLEAMALGKDLADQLPEQQAVRVRQQLHGMGISVFHIKTIPGQMLYDLTKIEIEADQSVLIVFENNDTMTHNLIITEPGAHEEVGTAADTMAAQPDARDRSFVPNSSRILWATDLLQPGEVARLSFTAPSQPGVYPFFCTYPGHWRRMFGAMYVVADLNQYQADPQAYLAEHPLPIADDLLKNNRSRTEWTWEQLAPSLEHFSHGRSFDNGKQMFQFAGCAACHRLSEVGHEVGPDLMKLDPKLKPSDILREVLVPSQKIHEDYHIYSFVLDSGVSISGWIVEETDDTVKVVENPAAESRSIVLKKAEIEDQIKLPVSIMPTGLLDQLTRHEILDLIGFVMSRGDRNSKLYDGDHLHHDLN